MAKTKLTSKIKAKSKIKLKSKSRAKPKRKLKSKAKLKKKSFIKKKSNIKNKVNTKKKRVQTASKKKKSTAKKKISKSIKMSKSSRESKTKSKLIRNAKKKNQLSDTQKKALLATITKIINLHKSDQDGLKSLTQIERILDKYNQKYTEVGEKFDAIVEYGVGENPLLVREHVFVPTQSKDKETLDLYKLLLDIGEGKIKFTDIKRRIEDLYADALESRQ